MKVAFAATPEQELHIGELIEYIYTEIFPLHFTDEYILKMQELNVLSPSEEELYYNGTLKEAFQLISSLQALIAVMETVQNEEIKHTHHELFRKNKDILKKYGYSFPLTIEQFATVKMNVISKFSKPTNMYLA